MCRIFTCIVKKFLSLILIMLTVTFVTFFMMHLAGSSVVEQKLSNTGEVMPQDSLDKAKSELGLDKPFIIQYLSWLNRALRCDLGTSYVSGKDITPLFFHKMSVSVILCLYSLITTLVLSLTFGIISALCHNSFIDNIIRFISFIGNSLPNFMVAILLLYLLAIKLKIFPVIPKNTGPSGFFMPALTLAVAMSSKYIRQIRTFVLEELDRDYVTGAIARGEKFYLVLWTNIMRSCMISLIPLLSVSIGDLLGGSAIIESIFMIDGAGRFALDAIYMRDYPVILAYVTWMSFIYAIVNFVSDIILHFIDPRFNLIITDEY